MWVSKGNKSDRRKKPPQSEMADDTWGSWGQSLLGREMMSGAHGGAWGYGGEERHGVPQRQKRQSDSRQPDHEVTSHQGPSNCSADQQVPVQARRGVGKSLSWMAGRKGAPMFSFPALKKSSSHQRGDALHPQPVGCRDMQMEE